MSNHDLTNVHLYMPMMISKRFYSGKDYALDVQSNNFGEHVSATVALGAMILLCKPALQHCSEVGKDMGPNDIAIRRAKALEAQPAPSPISIFP